MAGIFLKDGGQWNLKSQSQPACRNERNINMKILVTQPAGNTRDSFITPDCAELLEKLEDVEYNNTGREFTEAELREKLKGKDIALTGWGTAMLGKTVLEGNSRLKMIAHTGGTVNSLVDDYAYTHGIKVISGNDVYAESVAEAVIAYMLLGLRKIPKYMELVRANSWYNYVDSWEGLLDRTVGFISFGMIPKHLVKMLKPFRVKIKVYSSHISDEELKEYGMERATPEEVFSTCDVISIHSALNEKTRHMINQELLGKIQDGAVLINTSRGAVIDEAALVEEMKKNRFTAVLDVYEHEPLPLDHPLRSLPNVYPIPHMGGPTYDRRRFVTLALIEDMNNMISGKPLKMEISSDYFCHMTKQ